MQTGLTPLDTFSEPRTPSALKMYKILTLGLANRGLGRRTLFGDSIYPFVQGRVEGSNDMLFPTFTIVTKNNSRPPR